MKAIYMLALFCGSVALATTSTRPAHAYAAGAEFTCTAKSKPNAPACRKPDGTVLNITGTGSASTRPAATTAAKSDYIARCNAAGGGVNRDNIKVTCKKTSGAQGGAGELHGL